MVDLRKAILSIGIWLVVVILVVVLPGCIAFYGGGFDERGIIKKLKEPIKTQYKEYQQDIESVSKSIEIIYSNLNRLDSQDSTQEIHKLVDDLKSLEDFRNGMLSSPPIKIMPFYPLRQSTFVLAGLIYVLCLLVFVFKDDEHSTTDKLFTSNTFLLTIFIYFVYESPLWIRNILQSPGRKIFAPPNYDINPASFFAQEASTLLCMYLLSACWLNWSRESKIAKTKALRISNQAPVLDSSLAEQVTDIYVKWLWQSFLVGIGFFNLVYFYWLVVENMNDYRYIPSAIIAHLLWGVSWVLLSAPLFWIWGAWHTNRLRIIADLTKLNPNSSKDRIESTIKIMSQLEPMSGLSSKLGWLGAVISFLLPLLLNFIKK
jgi:hypothetical protein